MGGEYIEVSTTNKTWREANYELFGLIDHTKISYKTILVIGDSSTIWVYNVVIWSPTRYLFSYLYGSSGGYSSTTIGLYSTIGSCMRSEAQFRPNGNSFSDVSTSKITTSMYRLYY